MNKSLTIGIIAILVVVVLCSLISSSGMGAFMYSGTPSTGTPTTGTATPKKVIDPDCSFISSDSSLVEASNFVANVTIKNGCCDNYSCDCGGRAYVKCAKCKNGDIYLTKIAKYAKDYGSDFASAPNETKTWLTSNANLSTALELRDGATCGKAQNAICSCRGADIFPYIDKADNKAKCGKVARAKGFGFLRAFLNHPPEYVGELCSGSFIEN